MKNNFKETIKNLESQIEETVQSYVPDFSYEKELILKTCPEFLVDLSDEYDIFISGGMITSLFCKREINDIDIYLMNDNHVFPFVTELLQNSTLLVVTDKSMLVSHSGQTINVVLFKTFKDANDIFNSFDFTVCMGAFDLKNEQFFFHQNFFKHNSQRILKFNSGTDYPLVSALRVFKYLDKGYSISKGDHASILLTCSGLKIESYEVLESHIGGMYGLSLDKIIDTTLDFDLHRAISQLINATVEIDEAVDLITKSKDAEITEKIKSLLKRFSPSGNLKMVKNTKIAVFPSGRALSISKYMDVSKEEFFNGHVFLYKYVKKTTKPDEFQSFYRDSFLYKIGEEVLDEKHGLHCGVLDSKSNFTYSSEKDKVLIEMKVHTDDIKSYGSYSNTTVKKAVVTRVLKDTYINNDDNIDDLFKF